MKAARHDVSEDTLNTRAREQAQEQRELDDQRCNLEVREGRLSGKEEQKEDCFAQRLREACKHYRAEVVTLTGRLTQEGTQLRQEATLLRQAEQRA